MSHRYDWECRCPDCATHRSNLRGEMKNDFATWKRERESKSSPLASECKSSPLNAAVASCEPVK
jgi:hypothetical protein